MRWVIRWQSKPRPRGRPEGRPYDVWGCLSAPCLPAGRSTMRRKRCLPTRMVAPLRSLTRVLAPTFSPLISTAPWRRSLRPSLTLGTTPQVFSRLGSTSGMASPASIRAGGIMTSRTVSSGVSRLRKVRTKPSSASRPASRPPAPPRPLPRRAGQTPARLGGLLAQHPLQLAAHQVVELLVRAAELHVRLYRHGVVGLQQGVQQFVQADGLVGGVALSEVVPLQHLGHGEAGG